MDVINQWNGILYFAILNCIPNFDSFIHLIQITCWLHSRFHSKLLCSFFETLYKGIKILSFPLSEWLLFNANLAIFQLYYGDKLIFNRWWWDPLCTRPTRLVGSFIELAHWNNSPQIDMLPHSDTLSWFRANQSLLFLLKTVCLAEKQQIPILYSSVWARTHDLPHSRRVRYHYTTDAVSFTLMNHILQREKIVFSKHIFKRQDKKNNSKSKKLHK